ncbi:hypothetical protein JB92DRAFT_3030101 [Gautieria morchelliformis]|nr:hypothetical protein JB92DRAFT_3030101 [Gautieria morchelliformis]
MYIESFLRSSYSIPQVDTGLSRFWSPQVLLLALNKGWERGAAVHTAGDMCMAIYNGVIRSRFKRLITHLDKIASIPHIDKRVDKWLDHQLLSRELRLASSTLLPKEAINWDDVRIRRWDLKEVAENMDYWIKRMQATATRSMMKEVIGAKNSMVVTVGSSGMRAGKGEDIQNHVRAELARCERLMDESKPQWLKIAEQEDNTTKV